MSEIDDQTKKVLEMAFKEDAEFLNVESNMENFAGWDSLAFVDIMAAIEKVSGVKVAVTDAERISSVKGIAEIIAEGGKDG